MDHLGHGLALQHAIFQTPNRVEFEWVDKQRPKHYQGATSPLWPDGVPDSYRLHGSGCECSAADTGGSTDVPMLLLAIALSGGFLSRRRGERAAIVGPKGPRRNKFPFYGRRGARLARRERADVPALYFKRSQQSQAGCVGGQKMGSYFCADPKASGPDGSSAPPAGEAPSSNALQPPG